MEWTTWSSVFGLRVCLTLVHNRIGSLGTLQLGLRLAAAAAALVDLDALGTAETDLALPRTLLDGGGQAQLPLLPYGHCEHS